MSLDLTAVVTSMIALHVTAAEIDMSTNESTDQEFLDAFLEGRLTPEAFNHAGHVRAAWLLLQRYPLDEAIEMTCEGIRRLATQFGAPEKFNRTLSESWTRLLAARFEATLSWDAWRNTNLDLLRGTSEVLSVHYSRERLHSSEAKRRFISPDRRPLPSCNLQNNAQTANAQQRSH